MSRGQWQSRDIQVLEQLHEVFQRQLEADKMDWSRLTRLKRVPKQSCLVLSHCHRSQQQVPNLVWMQQSSAGIQH